MGTAAARKVDLSDHLRRGGIDGDQPARRLRGHDGYPEPLASWVEDDVSRFLAQRHLRPGAAARISDEGKSAVALVGDSDNLVCGIPADSVWSIAGGHAADLCERGGIDPHQLMGRTGYKD